MHVVDLTGWKACCSSSVSIAALPLNFYVYILHALHRLTVSIEI